MLSRHALSQDECFWFLAEMHARVGRLFNAQWDKHKLGQPAPQGAALSDGVLREQAYFLWMDNPRTLPELHWLLAEQQLLFDALVQRSWDIAIKYRNYMED
jgi:hypothetical protein